MKVKGSSMQSSQRRRGAARAPQPGNHNRLKSERVQLELEAQRSGSPVRKVVQRGAGGRFVQPLVLPADASLVPVAIVFGAGTPAAEEIVVRVPPGSVVAVKGVPHAAA